MKREEIIAAFVQLGRCLRTFEEGNGWSGFESGITEDEFDSFDRIIVREHQHNPWFTQKNVRRACSGIAQFLDESTLATFCANYTFSSNPKCVALVMAGNIPLVGFHDLLCVLLSGHRVIAKLSTSDARLPLHVIQMLTQFDPRLSERIHVAVGPMKNFDAVIATGSSNSVSHFDAYFGKYPHIFRKNRTSVAVLDGTESTEELKSLGEDCFAYFGLGCRNVTKLFLPKGFNTDLIFEGFVHQRDLIQHHKYGNNYDYNRTVYLMNAIPFLDNNCCMLKQDEGLHAPLSVVYYENYESKEEVNQFIQAHKEEIQAIVGHGYIPFGAAQTPAISDFADNVDTMLWLNSLD